MDCDTSTDHTITGSNFIPVREAFRNHEEQVFSDNEVEVDGDEDETIMTDAIDVVQETNSDDTSDQEREIEDELSSTEIKSPGGSKTIIWIPNVHERFLPKKGIEFDTLRAVTEFYEQYAMRGGFDVRKGGEKHKKGVLRYKYLICSRAGVPTNPTNGTVDTLKGQKLKPKRKRASQMISCQAKIGFKIIDGTEKYFIQMFDDKHNHPLFTKSTVHMSRRRRQLNFHDKTMIQQLGTTNIGATKAHSMVTSLRGGYERQGPKKTDYKNYSRDLNCRIGESDANMIVDILTRRTKNVPSFSFNYMLEGTELRALFWADGIAKKNYNEFCDVVAFDATFKTNKYNMVFVPFTGIDNHKRCITFGAGLLARETTEYYTWLLKSFVSSFHKQPKVVVTDQDAAMAKAVENVFTESTHRLCMWHIGKKLTDKVSCKIIYETDFRKRMQSLIWNACISPDQFEEQWLGLIDDFKLQDNKCLKEMYAIRDRWIPAYFKDVPLTGLMHTTSRSESENYFFKSFMSKKANLIMFMWKFDAAMEKQRHIQATSEYESSSKLPPLATILQFESQALKFYTHTIFNIFQKEIHDCVWSCSPGPVISLTDYESCIVLEQLLPVYGQNKSLFFHPSSDQFKTENVGEFQYQVKVYRDEETMECSCLVFEHYGILCRHVLCIMKKRFMKRIPEKYLLRRWQKGVIRVEDLQKIEYDGEGIGSCGKKILDAYSIFSDCINLAGHDEEAMTQFVEWQKEFRRKIQQNPPEPDTRTRNERLDAAIGISKPDEVSIRNPENINNKGGGNGKRIKGKREVALKSAGKQPRKCTWCEKYIPPSEKHDRRNCPERTYLEKNETSDSDDDTYDETDTE